MNVRNGENYYDNLKEKNNMPAYPDILRKIVC